MKQLSDKNTFNSNNELDDYLMAAKIRKFGQKILLFSDMIQEYNFLYGGRLMNVLAGVLIIILAFYKQLNLGQAMWVASFINYGLAIIVSSDSLMVECEKLLYSAHHYQSQTLKMSLLSVELKRFIAKLKHFKPIISAADFFEIRRPSILSMISGITTNSIIMIQLGDAKFEKNLEVRQRL
ncbi:unnamed protein product [Psylliodes chrysocephalus]|uniref:Uncharacterized protein n=1 Tax=Psylliodes chrysocephalus TaxID=3402493 RepID=A0A9P0G2I9_9CUCU|nr:unnamed protein product [Psylliodes chrysocephala]